MREANAEAIRPPAPPDCFAPLQIPPQPAFSRHAPFFGACLAVVMGDLDKADEFAARLLLEAARRFVGNGFPDMQAVSRKDAESEIVHRRNMRDHQTLIP